jgi:N-methylhydantoinase A
MLVADLRHDLVQTRLAAHRDLSPGAARAVFAPMLAEARRLLDADRVPPERQRIVTRLDMRYVGQSYELPIPVTGFSQAEWAALVPTFHAEHAGRFGHSDPKAPVEIVSFGVTATGLIDTPELPRPQQGGAEPPSEASSGTRRAYFEAGEGTGGSWAECPVWRREALLAGNRIAGPAIIEEISATTVLYPGDQGRVDEVGSLIVEIGA